MNRFTSGLFFTACVALILFGLFSPGESPLARLVAVVVGFGGLTTWGHEDEP